MTAVLAPAFPAFSACMTLPVERGPLTPYAGVVLGRQRLTTDSIGTTTVTFQGVNANSEIRVYLPDGTEAAGVETCTANHTLTWSIYPAGSDNNIFTIRVVHQDYKILEFNHMASAGNAALPIQQQRDKWYRNPA